MIAFFLNVYCTLTISHLILNYFELFLVEKASSKMASMKRQSNINNITHQCLLQRLNHLTIENLSLQRKNTILSNICEQHKATYEQTHAKLTLALKQKEEQYSAQFDLLQNEINTQKSQLEEIQNELNISQQTAKHTAMQHQNSIKDLKSKITRYKANIDKLEKSNQKQYQSINDLKSIIYEKDAEIADLQQQLRQPNRDPLYHPESRCNSPTIKIAGGSTTRNSIASNIYPYFYRFKSQSLKSPLFVDPLFVSPSSSSSNTAGTTRTELIYVKSKCSSNGKSKPVEGAGCSKTNHADDFENSPDVVHRVRFTFPANQSMADSQPKSPIFTQQMSINMGYLLNDSDTNTPLTDRDVVHDDDFGLTLPSLPSGQMYSYSDGEDRYRLPATPFSVIDVTMPISMRSKSQPPFLKNVCIS